MPFATDTDSGSFDTIWLEPIGTATGDNAATPYLYNEIDGEGNRMRFAYRLQRAMVLGYEELEGVMGELGAVVDLA